MRKVFIYLIFILLPMSVVAQERSVSGQVTSDDDGLPIPGVNITVQGSTKGTTTDLGGNYTITLGAGEETLIFSFVGYQTQKVIVGQQTVANVVLLADQKTLDEVVVIGYGTVRKSDLTGAVSSIKGRDLTSVPAVSPMQSLQGKVSGVQIISNSGAPGSGVSVRVRGIGTFNNFGPIYVVDGVITENIDYLNSADIESMEVLKDASATTIYGSRGANGVIMVTTKKGKLGESTPTVSVSSEYGVQILQRKIDVLSGKQFAIISNEITPGSFNNVDAVPNTNWQDEVFRAAPIQTHQVSLTGASDKIQYYIGLGYFSQDGIIPKSAYERFSMKFNNTFHVNKSVRLGNNITITPYKQQNTHGGVPFDVYRAQPTIRVRQADGSYSPVPGVGNTIAAIEYTNNFNRGLRSVSNFFGEVDIAKGLTFKSSIGVDVEFKKNESFSPEFFVSPQQQNAFSRLNKGYGDRTSWLWENTVNFDREIGIHRFNAVVGYTMQESTSENFSLGGQNIIRDAENFWYLNPDNVVGSTVSNSVDVDQNYAMISYLMRVNYSLLDRYLFTATFRRDGSSKFAKDNRYADFPAIAVGWNIINEPFMQSFEKISNLKLRASWGVVGNEKISYSDQYSRVLNGVGAVFGQSEVIYPGSTYGASGNSALGWEDTKGTDIGLELGFFNDQLTLETDYYRKITSAVLVLLENPGFLGNGEGARTRFNAAEISNSGFEFEIAYQNQWKDLRYRISTNGTTLKNYARQVYGPESDEPLPNDGSRYTLTGPGDELGTFYGYKVDGIFQNQEELDAYPHRSDAGVGDLRYVDINKDGFVNDDDRTKLGSAIPEFMYGFSVELGYKGFDFAMDWQGQSGNEIYNLKATVRPDLYNFEQRVFNRWTGEGTSNSEPRATAGGYNYLPSSRYVQDGSFLRLRNITLGYTLPTSISSKAKMRTARIYVRGTNVLTSMKYNGYSPEVPGGALTTGLDLQNVYPVSAIYAAGLNLTF